MFLVEEKLAAAVNGLMRALKGAPAFLKEAATMLTVQLVQNFQLSSKGRQKQDAEVEIAYPSRLGPMNLGFRAESSFHVPADKIALA